MKLLAIDIGNTSISLAIMSGRKIIIQRQIVCHGSRAAIKIELSQVLCKLKKQYDLDMSMICSVVPRLTTVVQSSIKSIVGINAVVIGKDVQVPIKNNYRFPEQVGKDRLVGAYGAKILYGYPAIIIDFGTAITVDVLDSSGAYDGGLIVPGIQMSAESLFNKTALLPKIHSIVAPKNLVGKDTEQSILSGIFYGYGVMCCGLIDAVQDDLHQRVLRDSKENVKPVASKVVVTGGYANLMKRFIASRLHKIDAHLVFRGMQLLRIEAYPN